MKTAFSLESQLDSAGPGASQNLIFSLCFEVLVLGVFLEQLCSTFIDFLRDFASFWEPILAHFGVFLGVGFWSGFLEHFLVARRYPAHAGLGGDSFQEIPLADLLEVLA